tara:strand:+ start:2402 stop:3028 length:627 start_codon:yes stop_codon:yes gene_type:complete
MLPLNTKKQIQAYDQNRGRRGVTLLEVLAAVSITIIGFVGVLDLQTASIHGLSGSRSMFHAMQLSEHFAETLRLEAVEWTNQSTQAASQQKFQFLNKAPDPAASGSQSEWIIATPDGYVGTMANFSTYDEGVLLEFPEDEDKRFCIHYRWTWLLTDLLVRADIRVLWPRPAGKRDAYKACELSMIDDPGNIAYIASPVIIMLNPSTAQ